MSNTTTETTSSSGGIGFSGLLAILFITLKLTGVITWSWLWVLSPIWIPLLIVIGVIGFSLLVLVIALFFSDKNANKLKN